MEVHHPHHPAHKKDIKEYLLEFFMLFFAVTLGFFAENIREHYAEVEKSEKYLHQLIVDLKQDTVKINSCLAFKDIKERQSDSLIALMNSPKIRAYGKEIYYFSRILAIREPFYGTEGTLKQLQNAGGFSIIKNDELIQHINAYISDKEKIYQIQNMQDLSSLQMRASCNRLFKSSIEHEMLDIHNNSGYRYSIKPIDYNAPLISYDPKDINDYTSWIVWIMTSEKYDYVLLKRLKKKSEVLIEEIKKELKEK